MIESEIKRHEELGQMSEQEKVVMKNNLHKQIDDMGAQMKERDSQIKEVERQLSNIDGHVRAMIMEFRNSNFFLSVAQSMNYDETTQFNENNVTQYLSELEEYISLLITFLAYRQENPDAAISSLNLEKMALKDFERGPINVRKKIIF